LPPKPKKNKSKRRVVLDTNVLVAGISGFKGRYVPGKYPSADVLFNWADQDDFHGWLLKTSWTGTKKFLSGEMFVRP